MNKISLSNQAKLHTTTIDNSFIDHYLLKASGENIKVMIMLMRLMQSGLDISTKELAKRLDMTEGAVNRALTFWEQEGIIEGESKSEPEKVAKTSVPEKKSLSSSQLKNKHTDENFRHLTYLAEMYLKHPMTNAELNSLCYIYDTLKLPVDLIEYLIEYCVSNHKTSFRYIEKVAISWHEKGILTPAQAKANSAAYQKEYYQIMKTMGLTGVPTPAQIEFMERWLYKDAHSMNLILEACKRSVISTGKGSFQYANSILDSWKSNGIRTLHDVKASDERFAASKAGRQAAHTPKSQPAKASSQIHNFNERSYNYDELEQLYIEKINQ